MTNRPSSPRPSEPQSVPDAWADEAEVEDFKPLTREEAQQWRTRQPAWSVWYVVRWQVILLAIATGAAELLLGNRAWTWSVFYGGLCAALPTALMAYGMTTGVLSRMLRVPGMAKVSLVAWVFWEGVKILLAVAMMALAPRWIADLSWPGLLIGLVVVLKAYWLGWLLSPRRPA